MFGSNPFGALADEQPLNAVAGPSLSQVDGEETDADWLELSKTNGEVYVRVSDKVELDGLPQECNLMAVSNTYCLVAVGGQTDVRIHKLEEIHRLLEESTKDVLPVSLPVAVLSLPARPVWVKLAVSEERLVVAMADGAGVCLFKLGDVVHGNTMPYSTVTSNIPPHLIDVLPNPAASSSSDKLNRNTALITPEGFVMLDIETGELAGQTAGSYTCGCWSAKGKQIVLGTKAGTLEQYTPDGMRKSRIPAPPELEPSEYYPTFVRWLENDLFLACYARIEAEDPRDPLEVFIIQRTKQSITYTKYFDVNDSMGVENRTGNHRFYVDLKQWGPTSKHLGFMASSIGTEIGVLHGAAEGDGSLWQAVFLGEMARGVLPGAKKGVSDEDTSVLAMEVDLTATKPVVRGMEGGVDLPDLPPPPRLLVYSQAGLLISFDVRYPDVGAYPGMITPQDIASVTASGDNEDMDFGTGANTPAPAEQPKPPATPSAFGTSSTSFKPGFGASAFGSSSTPSAFGQSSGFGSSAFGSTTPSSSPAPKAAFGQSAFGSSTTPSSKPAFGDSAFGSTTPAPKPAFGQSPFGSTTPSTTPAPKPAFGQSPFGSTTPSTTPAAKSAFGQTSFGSTTPSSTPDSKPAFGQSAFGAVASGSTTPVSKPTFGQTAIPAFGQSSTPAPSPFGQAAFGQSSKPAFGSSSFGQSSAPAFGQSTFGAAGSPSAAATKDTGAFGSSAFGQSAFGQSAFGQSAKPSQASAFGQTAEKPDSAAKSAFSFAGKADSSSTGVGSSAFGSGGSSPFAKKDATTPTFGSSPNPFAQAAPSSSPFGSGGSAFGSSAFGKPATSAFDTKPAFGKSPSQETPSPPADTQPTTGLFGSTKPAAPASKPSEDDFGLGGFASALGASSGPASPSEAKSAAPSSKSRVPGLEDSDEEEDDSSSKPKPSTSAGTTSAFIKPATGFAQASSGGFGVFGQTASAPKTAPSSTPAAFSAPPPATSAFGKPASTSSGVAFGQSSKPGGSVAFGQSSTPAAGGAAFGKPSAPVAFGQAATPATTGFGNISGGFGGFGKASTGGFGGFASSSSGESIFAKKEDKPLGPTTPAFGAKPASTVPVFGQSKQSSAPVFGAKTATPQPAAEPPASKRPEVKAPAPATPSTLSSPDLTASSVEDDAVEPEPAVMPAGYATTPAAAPKSPVAPKAAKPEPAVIPPGYDVPGEIPAPAESTGDDVAPAIVEAASAVPLPPTESPAPIRLPPVETIAAQLPPAVGYEVGNDSRPGDISPTKSLDEGVLVEREEAPSAVSGEDAQDYGSDHEYDDEYDYEEEVEGEGEEYDTEENDDEEDDDEEDSAASRRRRSVSLAPPEMSPIAEEPGDLDEAEDGESVDDDDESVDDDEQSEYDQEQSGGEDGGDGAARPPLKSPPAWFSNTAPSGPNVPSSSEGGASDSVFGRLGPAPSGSAASKLPPAFSLKHAVKTSSPLGQPPQTADRSPPGTSTKPASSAFSAFANASSAAKDGQSAFGANKSGFGQGLGLGKPPSQAAKPPSEETKPVFSGFGLGQTTSQATPSSAQDTKPVFGSFDQSSTDSKPAVTKPAFSGFGLGQTAAQPAPAKAPEDKQTFGGFGSTAKTDMPSADAKPSFGGFGGFGQTATSSQTAASAAEGFVGFGQPKSSTPAASPGGLFGSVKTMASAPPPPAAPAVPPTDFSIPPRQPVPTVRDVPSDGKRTMTAVLERMIASLVEDIHQLKDTLAQNERYHRSFTIANFPKITADNLDKHATLPFSSLEEFRGIIDALSTEVAQIVSDQAGVDVKLSDVQSKLLKSDMKVGQAEKFVQARQDPSFAGVMQIKELSIDQAESQARLREMVQATEDTLTQLEAGIANLKKRVQHRNEARLDDSDALDRVQKSVRDMDTAIRDHAETIDELAGRIASIRVGTSSRRRESTPSAPVNAVKGESMAATSFQTSAAVTKAVQDSLARQSKLRARLVARSGETARLTTLDPKAGGTGVLSHVSLIDGPISVDATPLPGSVDVKPDESGAKASSLSFATKDSALTPSALPNAMATGTAAPTSMFGNITFGKLDPGTITRASAAERKSATSGGSSRGHQSAPKFGGGLVGSGGSKTSETPSLSFVPPPPATGSKAAPSGFFSLSSFNK